MKFRLLIICFLYAIMGFAQQRPVSFAVHHTYGKEEGMQPGTNFSVFDQQEDGSMIARMYGKDFWRISPTGARRVHVGSTMHIGLPTEINSIRSGKGVFYAYLSGLMKVQGDSLQAYGPQLKVMYGGMLASGDMLVATAHTSDSAAMLFDGNTYRPLPLPPGLLLNFPVVTEVIQNAADGLPYVVLRDTTLLSKSIILRYDEGAKKLAPVSEWKHAQGGVPFILFGTDSMLIQENGKFVMRYANNPHFYTMAPAFSYTNGAGQLIAFAYDGFSRIYKFNAGVPYYFRDPGKIQYLQPDRFYNSVYIGTQTHVHRLFPHVQQYPALYAPGNSLGNHTLAQTEDGTIYAGSYNGFVTAIKGEQRTLIDVGLKAILPGGVGVGNRAYMFAELSEGILAIGAKGHTGTLHTNAVTGYFITPSPDGQKVYGGFHNYWGIGIIGRQDLEAGRPNWTFIDSSKGMRLLNVLTVCEDPRGRLWFGRISQGWGVYYPQRNRATTYLKPEGTTALGVMATHCDKQGTVWLGGSDGIWMADGNQPDSIKPSDIYRMYHPMLPEGTEVMNLTVWGDYLVFTAGQQVLMLYLPHFYQNKTAILQQKMWPRISYINPHELSLNPLTTWKQNCNLIDHTDSSLWLGANDNMYRIHLRQWLSLKRPHATPTLMLAMGDDTLSLEAGKRFTVPPTRNSLSFYLRYQTTDNLPRLMQVALVAAGDSARWSAPDTEAHFEAWNRQTGQYIFRVRIIEHDGTINEFAFPITIRRFLWQQWWFWLLLCFAVGGVAFYGYYLYKQKELAEANAARLAAEADAMKAEQKRQLTAMQVKSLSTQFRPHFILNALNTIGAQLYDKPDVDNVLGQLGDSIGIIFRNAQSGSIAHSLSEEWKLVESVINIKQMELGHSVQLHMQEAADYCKDNLMEVPMGILQIPVENALVHGLRNKEEGSKDLWIQIQEDNDGRLCVCIRDNGVGRKAAAAMGNYRSNGVGSQNLQSILDLLNPLNEQPITVAIMDLPIEENGRKIGTEVKICIPKTYQYGT